MLRRCVPLAALMLAACAGPAPDALDVDQKIVRAVLDTLASDGKPVCVSRLTFGSPLSQYRVARRGRLQRYYVIDWFPAGPFRPPAMPTQEQLRAAVDAQRDADIPEPPARTDELPREERSLLDSAAFAISPPGMPLYSAIISQSWVPKNVHPRWWPGKDEKLGCDANFVLSGIKRNDHVAFVAVRVHHWGTLYALAPSHGQWKVIAQWGHWLY